MRNYLISIAVLLLTLLNLQDANAQVDLKSVEGVVTDTSGMGLKGASVRLVSQLDTMTTTTNENGFYTFSNVKGKNINLSFSMLGYQIINKSISTSFLINNIFVPKITLYPQNHPHS
ncbi:carboxypeptidase-like regulatory domain-containing protein [Sphingobacterium daejeonense]|uniref:carboxypeptidase-like regulatory domain-containing protein n=1 Tax=Sphingobacterium daejeonense TaxID=371142 RepID=UPI0010C5574C|nr:carboxypeptidase-like regulatory domain-containing protein [Sphingobacterium daejeonense]VTP96991.1 TonB-linked outer membrane protein, SusC/RagA family [Sphingobacterium daejeonense]